jgi:hypothetical protein
MKSSNASKTALISCDWNFIDLNDCDYYYSDPGNYYTISTIGRK